MAEIAGSYWSGIWAARDKDPGVTADYLKDYGKTLWGPQVLPAGGGQPGFC